MSADVVGIVVNGTIRTVPRGTTLAQLVAQIAATSRGVALALDRQVVPRSSWEDVVVGDGANVEVVTAAAGG